MADEGKTLEETLHAMEDGFAAPSPTEDTDEIVASEEENIPEGDEHSPEGEEIEAAPAAEVPESNPLLDVVRENTESAKRAAELYERLLREREQAAKPAEAPKGPTLEEQYTRLLQDHRAAAQAMQHPDINLDPTNVEHVALFRNMTYTALMEERDKSRAEQVSKLEARLAAFELERTASARQGQVSVAWDKATAAYDLSGEDAKETVETLRAAIDSLVQGGTAPEEAVQSVLKPFARLLPKKGTSPAASQARSPEAARGLAAAAVAGRGANRSQALRRGTTDERALRDFEKSLFGSN